MPVGMSDGSFFDDEFTLLAESQASVASRMPPGASEKLAGAFKSSGSTQTPDNEENLSAAFLQRLTGTPTPRPVKDILVDWAKEKASHFVDALKAPGDAWAGSLDPMSPQGIERATSLAGLMVMGPAPIASKMADGSLGSFAGVRSQTMKGKYSELGEAQVMKANGEHPDDIFKKTGMFQGADGRWRYEIDDSKAKFFPENLEKRGGVAYLSDVYSHPELFKAYPDLKYVTVHMDDEMSGAAFGTATGQSYIRLGTQPMDNGRVGYKDQGVLAHEIQHWIQQHEGFAPGAFFEGVGVKGEPKVEHYLRSAGEVEARNVDTRLHLSEAYRRGYPPNWSEDYSRARQIVTRGVGKGTDQGLEDLQTGQMLR